MQTEKLQDGISGNSAAVKSFSVGGPEVLLLLAAASIYRE